MAAKRLLISFGLGALLATTGCQAWCARHYPCPTPVYANAAPQYVPCVPCCPTNYGASAPVSTWNQPIPRTGTCVCP
jgi:hypothetical protein